jgi:hypothetical protein
MVILLFMPSVQWLTLPYPALLVEMEFTLTFCLGWSHTTILPVAASRVTGITVPGPLKEFKIKF